jgi:peptidoglycan-associated lipoprotein
MRSRAFAVQAIMLVALAAGCAKTPATFSTSTAAPAPTGSALNVSNPPGGGTGTALGSGTGAGSRGADAGRDASGRPQMSGFAGSNRLTDIYFDFDRYGIRTEDAKMLDASAAWLKANPNQLVMIEGHCDERGTTDYNLALGERRAKAAQNYLVAQGVDLRRISIVSYGKEKPQCSESNESCWQRNRRAHFLVKPQ